MTAPEEEQPPPQSPQATELEEALQQAEDAITPVIAGMLIAAAATAVAAAPLASTNGVLVQGALFTPAWIADTTVGGLDGLTVGSLLMLVHPLVLGFVRDTAENAPERPPYGSVDYSQIAKDAALSAIEGVAKAMRRYREDPRSNTDRDVYDLFGDTSTSDPRTAPQRRAESFGRRTARWMVREAIFQAQSRLAPLLGYTHKRWITERDNRVRSEHAYLDGKAIPLRATFHTPTGSLRYPGDMLAPPHLVINCRCALEWLKRG